METLAARPIVNSSEKLKSFDLLANVDALKYDIEHFGEVLPETREQVMNEQLSYLTEGIDRAARTIFPLQRQGDELVYFDDGAWRPYSAMMATGLEAARQDAMCDPRKAFLADWAQNDYYHYSRMRQLQPGEQHVWASAYPHDKERQFGAKLMDECGLVSDRQMGYLYRAHCRPDGWVVLESQTIDRSDDEAIAAALDKAESNPSADMDDLVDEYDSVLEGKHGGDFYAGRRGAERHENAWQEILKNRDLAEYLINGLESIARRSLPRQQLERATKRHIYGTWALFKKRLDGTARTIAPAGIPTGSPGYAASQAWLAQEVKHAFNEFASQGQVLVGCGGAISIVNGETDIMNASSGDVLNSIFGSKNQKDCEFTSKECPKCHAKNVKTTAKNGRYYGACGCKS